MCLLQCTLPELNTGIISKSYFDVLAEQPTALCWTDIGSVFISILENLFGELSCLGISNRFYIQSPKGNEKLLGTEGVCLYFISHPLSLLSLIFCSCSMRFLYSVLYLTGPKLNEYGWTETFGTLMCSSIVEIHKALVSVKIKTFHSVMYSNFKYRLTLLSWIYSSEEFMKRLAIYSIS